jgi:ribosomal protein L9
MEIILKANVPHLGKMLDVVKVKDGYARNFLFPRKLAVRATKEAKLEIENNRAAVEAVQKELAAAGDVAAKLSQISVNLERRVVEGERLYGSVTAADIADAITKQGVKVTRLRLLSKNRQAARCLHCDHRRCSATSKLEVEGLGGC